MKLMFWIVAPVLLTAAVVSICQQAMINSKAEKVSSSVVTLPSSDNVTQDAIVGVWISESDTPFGGELGMIHKVICRNEYTKHGSYTCNVTCPDTGLHYIKRGHWYLRGNEVVHQEHGTAVNLVMPLKRVTSTILTTSDNGRDIIWHRQ